MPTEVFKRYRSSKTVPRDSTWTKKKKLISSEDEPITDSKSPNVSILEENSDPEDCAKVEDRVDKVEVNHLSFINIIIIVIIVIQSTVSTFTRS